MSKDPRIDELDNPKIKEIFEMQSDRIAMMAASFSSVALLTRVLMDVVMVTNPELLKAKLVSMLEDLEQLGMADDQETEMLEKWISNVDEALLPTDWLSELEGKKVYDA